MTLEEFYQEFKAAHRKYPMQVMNDATNDTIRHPVHENATYCPITAVARNLIDTDSPIVHGKVLPKSFCPTTVGMWWQHLGLSAEDAQLIISAADNTVPARFHTYIEVEEIRKKLLSILHKENMP